MSEPRTWVKIPLFLSSYFPLWLIFLGYLFLDPKYEIFTKPIKENYFVITAVIVLLTIMIGSIVITRLLIWNVSKGNNPRPVIIKEKENLTSEYMLYVVTYVIPFLIDNFLDYSKLFALIVMMSTIGTLYIRGNMIHINPALNLFGYRLYKIKDDSDNKLLLLTKQSSISHDEIFVNSMNQNIYVEIEN